MENVFKLEKYLKKIDWSNKFFTQETNYSKSWNILEEVFVTQLLNHYLYRFSAVTQILLQILEHVQYIY